MLGSGNANRRDMSGGDALLVALASKTMLVQQGNDRAVYHCVVSSSALGDVVSRVFAQARSVWCVVINLAVIEVN